ncbi:hypothetical protein Pint_01882 [Pistacia integerrima]|uniref:Uncharacterized protein n=1 Tax=Pistacia integerrima TaxID=434235 RepID=A0ACC0ZRT6_9ROSI|nr:hypothetical protein Pint_01882 [Pistacia integerrima]
MASFKPSIPVVNPMDGAKYHHRASGEVHVIIGPMFAGKTTALLRRIRSEGNNGRNVAMIKSSKDKRYAVDSVVTHDGIKFPCWALSDLTSFRQKLGDDAYEKLTARCELCGKRAFFTFRKTMAKQTELIAGADVYMPVCRQHYVNGQLVIEAANASSVLECRKVQSESRLEVEAAVAI